MNSSGKPNSGPVCVPHAPAMSPQQRRLAAYGTSPLKAYKNLMVGKGGWLEFAVFEAYNLFFSSLGSVAGMGLRCAMLPFFCKAFGRKSVVGRGVTIRRPRQISIGKGVVIDDAAVIDVRELSEEDGGCGIEIGDHALIGRGTIIAARGARIRLGRAVNISSYCRIATQSGIEIGESALIAAYAYIGCANHTLEDTSVPMIEQPVHIGRGVRIGEHAWIGTHTVVLDGVTIGSNAVVGAHALVKEDVPANAIVAGIPARLVRMR